MAIHRNILVVVAVIACLNAITFAQSDVTAGLDCTKDSDGNVVACTGKNPVLAESEKKINQFIKDNNVDVQSKVDVLQTRTGGPQYCQSGGCSTTVNKLYTPSLLFNTRGQPRFVLQLPDFNQYVYLTVCQSENGQCGYNSKCEQQRFSYNLLVWDPQNPYYGLNVEEFSVPSGCCCSRRRGGYDRPRWR